MNNSQTSRQALIAVMAASLLAVGVVTAISMTQEADAYTRQSNRSYIDQTAIANGGSGINIASNSASVSQSNSGSSSSSSSTVCTNGQCTTTP